MKHTTMIDEGRLGGLLKCVWTNYDILVWLAQLFQDKIQLLILLEIFICSAVK